MKIVRFALAFSLACACAPRIDEHGNHRFACSRDGGTDQCPAQWTCGKSGYCQDPSVGEKADCDDDTDCAYSAGWKCGLDHVCYDRSQAGAVQCPVDAGAPDSFCADGWRCGLEGQCHQKGVAGTYRCGEDTDCEANFRCGPAQRCVDVQAQALKPHDVTVYQTRHSPVLQGPFSALTLDYPGVKYSDFSMSGMEFVSAGQVLAINTSSYPALATRSAAQVSASVTDTTWAFVPSYPPRELLVSDNAGLWDYTDALDGGAPILLSPSLANAHFYGPHQYDNETAVLAADTFGYGNDISPLVVAPLPTGVVARDFAMRGPYFNFANPNPRDALYLIATNRGLLYSYTTVSGEFVTRLGNLSTSPDFRPGSLPGLPGEGCGAQPTVDLSRVAVVYAYVVVLTATNELFVYQNLDGNPPPFASCSDLNEVQIYGACPPCPAGEEVVDFETGDTGTASYAGINVLCAAPASTAAPATHRYLHRLDATGCNLTELQSHPAAEAAFQPDLTTYFPDGIDALGIPRACMGSTCGSFLETRPPEFVSGGPDMLLAEPAVGAPDTVTTLKPSVSAGGVGQVLVNGFVRSGGFPAYGSFRDRPDWTLSQSVSGQSPNMAIVPIVAAFAGGQIPPPGVRDLATLERSADLVLGSPTNSGTIFPAHALTSADSQGGSWAIVGIGDRIWAANDPTLGNADAGVVTLSLKTVPLPYGTIESMDFAPGATDEAGATPLLDGYVVDQLRLFRVRANSTEQWVSDEITLANAHAKAVWMDGHVGRVGTRKGVIYGLPIPVPISEGIIESGAPAEVLDYGTLCGDVYAITSSSLYHLVVGAGVLGTWEQVPNTAFPQLPATGAKYVPPLHAARTGGNDYLYLFTDAGAITQLRAACP